MKVQQNDESTQEVGSSVVVCVTPRCLADSVGRGDGELTGDMEGDIGKRGLLYLQQQRFGKKWRKVWSVLYRESACSISRLEFFECKDGTSTLEKPPRKQDNKKVIKLSDCIRVSEVVIEGCPRDCGPFLVETTEKMFIFAAENAEVEDWTQKLCEIAFPMSWGERAVDPRRSSPPGAQREAEGVSMENNCLYAGRQSVAKDYKVMVRHSEVADKCGLKGAYLIRTDFESIVLREPRTGEVLYTWPYRYLRRFGRDKTTFSFEAGRRCESGEGNLEFETKHGNAIFKAVEAAINVQRSTMTSRHNSGGALSQEKETPANPPAVVQDPAVYSLVPNKSVKSGPSALHSQRSHLEAPVDKLLTGVKSLNLDARPMPRKSQVKNFNSCPLAGTKDQTYSQITLTDAEHGDQAEHAAPSTLRDPDPDYSLPFDSIATNIMVDLLHTSRPGPVGEKSPEPLYDSIDEMAVRTVVKVKRPEGRAKGGYAKAEHIYDEPEGCAMAPAAPPSYYDSPEEVKGNAWKKMGEATDPSGHEYPYNPNADDYAVPNRPRRAVPADYDDGSPYDNVKMKVA
ncbi:docking protein 2 isoform X2 [Denticeps clupeoides]|uniref:Docking protein 2 n=1 Tax=Denticeps clupeoides TaxID=299321 RepID=A0AAY4DE01_9TELE|nr:docking protein 2 isoform X2 [Denticeps clupeoides]